MLSSGSVFGNSPLHDELYQSVVSGWNDKRAAPSKVLSNLTPFVELYCVFGSNDIIYNNNEPSRFTAIESRLCEVKLRNAEDKPFEDPSGNGITEDCKIARVGLNLELIKEDGQVERVLVTWQCLVVQQVHLMLNMILI